MVSEDDFTDWLAATDLLNIQPENQLHYLWIPSGAPEDVIYLRDAAQKMVHTEGPKKGAPKTTTLFEGFATAAIRQFFVRGETFTVLAVHQTPEELVNSGRHRSKELELSSRRASEGYRPTLKQDNREFERRIKLVQDIVREAWEEAEPGGPRWTRNKVLGWINDRLVEAGEEGFSTDAGRPLWRAVREVIPSFHMDTRTMPGQPTGFRPQPGVQFPAPISGGAA